MFYLILFLVVVTCLFFYKTMKKGKKPDNSGGPCPVGASKPVYTAPSKDKPIFAGIRVVEVCEVVASPICCRILADMGADVIKIERPGGNGDLARTLLAKEFEKDRIWSSGFDQVNTSKRGAVLDLKKETGKQRLFKLLKDADVFVTNTRYQALQKLGLTYDDLHKEFPHLVYCHLSAFGTKGPDATSPGFDTTAFWVNTGLAASIHRPGLFTLYPAGFGDVTAGSLFFAGLVMALKAKSETGIGLNVTNSLFRTGLYVQSSALSHPHKPEVRVPDYQPADVRATPLTGAYAVKNHRFVHIGVLGDEGEHLANLEKIIPGVQGKSGTALYTLIASELETMDIDEAVDKLRSVGIPCEPQTTNFLRPTTTKKDHPDWTKANAWLDSFVKDNDRLGTVPFDCGDPEIHQPRCRSPYLGQHTEHVLDNGWYERHAESALPKATKEVADQDAAELYGKPLLSELTIVELSDVGVAASSCCQLAADFGARVIKVEPEKGDFWREKDPNFFATLNRGKSSVVDTGDEALLKLLEGADAFVTNQRVSVLKNRGLDRDTLRAKFPNLIYCVSSPRGYEGDEENRADNLVWFGEANLNSYMEPVPPGFPLQMGELMTGTHLFAGLTAAIFHKHRCGVGEYVQTNLKRAALYGGLFLNSFVSRNPEWEDFICQDPRDIDTMRYYMALISFYCYKTKDDVWIQLIGVDIARDGKKLIGVLGLWPAVLKGLPKILLNFLTAKGTTFLKFREIGKVLVPIFENKIAELTFDEITTLFDDKGVWWCKIMTADQMTHHPQVKFLNLLPEFKDGHQVATPLTVGSYEKNLGKVGCGKVPELGEMLD